MDPEQAGCVLAAHLGLAHMLWGSQSAAGRGAGFPEVLVMGEAACKKAVMGKTAGDTLVCKYPALAVSPRVRVELGARCWGGCRGCSDAPRQVGGQRCAGTTATSTTN